MAALSGWPESRTAAVITAVVAITRPDGLRNRRTVPSASQGTQATVAVTGNSPQERIPPPRAKPPAASSDEARVQPTLLASSHVPEKATRILSASVASRWCWMGKIRAAMASGESAPAWGFAQSALPPSYRSDQKGSRLSESACRTSSSQGRIW
jgi:hypothetical protein